MKKGKRASLTLRLPVELREWLANNAKMNFTSLNDEVIRSIRERMERNKKEKGEVTASKTDFTLIEAST